MTQEQLAPPTRAALITGLHHLRLHVRDADDAARDYAKLLGQSASWQGDLEGKRAAAFALSNLTLLFVTDAESLSPWICFRVADIERMRRRLERLEIPLVDERDPKCRSVAAFSAAEVLLPVRESTRGLQFAMCAQGSSPHRTEQQPAVISALDHLVLRSSNSDLSAALLGARYGLDLRMDLRRPDWRARLQFFRCGDLILEVMEPLGESANNASTEDGFYGLSWRVADAEAARRRLVEAGVSVSELRKGRKPGTRVFTAKSHSADIPTLVLQPPGTG